MSAERLYWKSLEERAEQLAEDGRAPMPAAVDPGPDAGAHDALALTRRGFLLATGFTLAGAAAGCGRPDASRSPTPATRAEELVPGRALHYASTCAGCSAGCGVLVKCVDGRPIKLEGNPEHPLSAGGLCAAGQAEVLALYDSRRLLRPRGKGGTLAWDAVDVRVRAGLETARAAGAPIRLVTGTLNGPSVRAWLREFLAAYPTARHVTYDALSWSACAAAHERTHGVRAVPRWRLAACAALLAVECDPLGTGPSPVEHTRGWRAARDLGGEPARLMHHEQVESVLTLSGSNADRRHRVGPREIPALVAHVAARLAAKAGATAPAASGAPPLGEHVLDEMVERLWAARGRALVLCGVNDVEVQALVNVVNEHLGAYGSTLDLEAPALQRLGDDEAFGALLEELATSPAGVLLVAGANPVADAPDGARLGEALARAGLGVVLAAREDETTARAELALPLPHALEAWDDAEPVDGLLTLTQPAIQPLGEPRSLRASLAAWLGKAAPERDLVRATFEGALAARLPSGAPGFTRAVHDGFVRLTPARAGASAAFRPAGAAALAPPTPLPAGTLALTCMPQLGMLDGRHAHNPWLHELPDPITKQVWGNAAQLAPDTARELGLADGDVVRLSDGTASIELPVLVQPGLAARTVAVALGYGRAGTDRFQHVGPQWLEARPTVERGGTVGASVAGFLRREGGSTRTTGRAVRLERTGRHTPLARTQIWHSQELPAHLAPARGAKREMVREIGYGALGAAPVHAEDARHDPAHAVLWDSAAAPGERRWGLVIDLSACTGCSACVVACQAENNVPVVGKDEVLRRRDMAWIRIDRYYAEVHGTSGDVDVVHQPMLCAHCGNAPCESVCPVLATSHSSEGLNEQTYNRCVGTRYCANNCPFKVRRFNWFAYDPTDPWAELALNPDVTVRSRGVMEKCSLCVQRIAEAKAVARVAGRPLAEGDVQTACQQSCPAGAIVFGDRQDPASGVARARRDARAYTLLDELNLKPAVAYLAKVRRREDLGGGRHG